MSIIDIVRKIERSKDALPPEKVETPGRIEAIIVSAIKERRMLEVAADERFQIFSSSGIIEKGFHRGRASLMIDTLIPKLEGIRALDGATNLVIGFRLNNVPHTFNARFLGLSKETSPIVILTYPETIFIHQFRGAFRLSPSVYEPILVNVESMIAKKSLDAGGGEGNEESEGVQKLQEDGDLVEDISIEGMAFLTKNKDLVPGIEVFVDFKVPGAGYFETRAVVINLFRTENLRNPFKCGIRFKDLTRLDKEKIYRYILVKQREEIKKRQGIL